MRGLTDASESLYFPRQKVDSDRVLPASLSGASPLSQQSPAVTFTSLQVASATAASTTTLSSSPSSWSLPKGGHSPSKSVDCVAGTDEGASPPSASLALGRLVIVRYLPPVLVCLFLQHPLSKHLLVVVVVVVLE
jgi:hypothetical protein